MSVQNFIKLSAAVYELLCKQRQKNLAENNTASASAGSNWKCSLNTNTKQLAVSLHIQQIPKYKL